MNPCVGHADCVSDKAMTKTGRGSRVSFNSLDSPGTSQKPCALTLYEPHAEQPNLPYPFQEPREETASVASIYRKETTGLSKFPKVTKLVKNRARM